MIVILVDNDERQILPSLSSNSPRNGCPFDIKPSINFVKAESPLSIILVRNFLFLSNDDDNV
jgi:hypothetical protein